MFVSRHEIAEMYGVYATAQFLKHAPTLAPAERVAVSSWEEKTARYFALSDSEPIADDNAINFDDIDVFATIWLGSGQTKAKQKGGANWAARYLVGQTDNTGRAVSWGYEYESPTFAHIAQPLKKIAYLSRREDWLKWAERISGSATQNFVLRRAGLWGALRNYNWGEIPDAAPADTSFFVGLQTLPMPPQRAEAINAQAPDSVFHSFSTRSGVEKTDALAVMIGANELYWNNAIAGALVHFSSHGQNWLRGSYTDAYLSKDHNRVFVSSSATGESLHNVELIWQQETPDYRAREIREAQSNGAIWTRAVVLWKQGSLLVADRVLPARDEAAPENSPPWLAHPSRCHRHARRGAH